MVSQNRPFNEGKACEAVLRHLKEREVAPCNEIWWPEKENHCAPVDLAFRLGEQLYAIEHTGIEPFERYVEFQIEMKKPIQSLKRSLGSVLPNDILKIIFELDPDDFRITNNTDLIDRITEYVKQIAPGLELRQYDDYRGDAPWHSIEGLPSRFKLYRFSNCTKEHGKVIFSAPVSNLDDRRSERLDRACKEKFPKLNWWKTECGARTILILEENDLFFTNHYVVADTYLSLAREQQDRPDETYLLSSVDEPWTVLPILIDDQNLYDLAAGGPPRHWQVSPSTLSAATSR